MAEIKRGELFFVRILRTALLYTRFSEARLWQKRAALFSRPV